MHYTTYTSTGLAFDGGILGWEYGQDVSATCVCVCLIYYMYGVYTYGVCGVYTCSVSTYGLCIYVRCIYRLFTITLDINNYLAKSKNL